MPPLARVGRRTAEKKRLARSRRPPLPADSATGVALWQGDRFEPAIPQNPPHRVLEQQARLAARLGPAGSDLDDRSLNTNTFRADYVLMGYALPDEARCPAVH